MTFARRLAPICIPKFETKRYLEIVAQKLFIGHIHAAAGPVYWV